MKLSSRTCFYNQKIGESSGVKDTVKKVKMSETCLWKENLTIISISIFMMDTASKLLKFSVKIFLGFLREEESYFDIELKGGRLYIYDSTAVKTKKEFEELFKVAGRVINRITPVLERLKNDFDALNEYFLEAD